MSRVLPLYSFIAPRSIESKKARFTSFDRDRSLAVHPKYFRCKVWLYGLDFLEKLDVNVGKNLRAVSMVVTSVLYLRFEVFMRFLGFLLTGLISF